MKITTIGIDLAKTVFQVHGVDERGKVLLRKQLKRKDVAVFFANLEPCLIGMEACGSAHYWGRTLSGLGRLFRACGERNGEYLARFRVPSSRPPFP